MRFLDYYSRTDVQQQLLMIAQNREVQVWFHDVRGKRPDTINLLGDVKDLVKQGVTSFHVSEERWHDPLMLKSGMTKRDLDQLRQGWDSVLDIDSKNLTHSTICADLIIEAIKFHDIKNSSLKYSGNRGFHIGIPFEAFPDDVNGIAIKDYFPEGIRIIAAYLKDMVKEHLSKRILENETISTIAQNLGKNEKELLSNNIFDPYKVVDIDSVLISSRHLFRAPYSINEKSGLVSIPLKSLSAFTLDDAKPDNVKIRSAFLDREHVSKGEARQLLIQAFDWAQRNQSRIVLPKEQPKTQHTYTLPQTAISEEHFPSCIQKLIQGISEDGRKRAIFILVNFLRNMGWTIETIETFLLAWNKKNYEPLRDGYIRSQIQWFKRQDKITLPPNCENVSYYKALGIYCGEQQCSKCKNPVNYTLRKIRYQNEQKKPKPAAPSPVTTS